MIFARRPALLPTSVAPARTEQSRASRASRREQRRLAALRRTDSGRSVATLPTYKVEPGEDEEQILLKRLESGSEGGHEAPAYDAPAYDPSPRPEHPPTWSEIHGHDVERPGSPHSSTWSTATSSDSGSDDEEAEEAEARTARARRVVVGESSGRLLGSASLKKHLQRGASFRLSPAQSRMSSIRSVFTARTHQSSIGHARTGPAGDSVDRLLPRTQERHGDEDGNEGEEEALEAGDEAERPRSRGTPRASSRAAAARASGEVARSATERQHRNKKLQRKATA